MSIVRIAFLHLAPCLRDLQANRRLIDRAVTTAATAGATWILTPELCICGYDFTDDLGTAWIVPPPDPWMASLCQRAAHLGVKAQGAQMLVSAAVWGPGMHGPDGEWERCSRATGLPLLVCNRTGIDRTRRFTGAESLVVKDGERLCTFTSERSAMFLIAWDLETQTCVMEEHRRVDL